MLQYPKSGIQMSIYLYILWGLILWFRFSLSCSCQCYLACFFVWIHFQLHLPQCLLNWKLQKKSFSGFSGILSFTGEGVPLRGSVFCFVKVLYSMILESIVHMFVKLPLIRCRTKRKYFQILGSHALEKVEGVHTSLWSSDPSCMPIKFSQFCL